MAENHINGVTISTLLNAKDAALLLEVIAKYPFH